MPLTWNISNCQNADSLMVETFIDPNKFGEQFTEDSTNDQRNMHRITTHIGMLMPRLGVNEITSDNVDSVTVRYRILCQRDDLRVGVWHEGNADGELEYYKAKLDRLQFRDRIGMKANVVALTFDEWVASLGDGYTIERSWEVADCWDA